MKPPARTRHQSQQRLEPRHDLVGKFEQLVESLNNRLTLGNLRLCERYFKGELRILLHIRFRDAVDYVALLECIVNDVGTAPEGFVVRDWLSGESPCHKRLQEFISDARHNSACREGRSCCDNHAVLVDNIQPMELPKQVIPSLGWRWGGDGGHIFLPPDLFLSLRSGFLIRRT